MAVKHQSPDQDEKDHDPLDDALADSFPASDPVSVTVPTVPGKPVRSDDGDPKGE